MNKILLKIIIPVICLGVFSCEEDFLNIESDVNAGQNFVIETQEFPVTAYTEKTGPVQVNGLPTNYLGVFNDETYTTKTVSNIVTEIVPTSFDPDLGDNPSIDSVTVFIPYFSSLTARDDNGDATYDLEGFLGDENATYRLSILKSNYLLRELDPATNFEEQQAYYSDFYTTTLEAQDDNYTVLHTIEDFAPSNEQIKLYTFDDAGNIDETSRLIPGFRQELYYEEDDTGAVIVDNRAFWNDLMGIVANGSGTVQVDKDYFTNANNFKTFFRGLIFKVEATSGSNAGSFVMLNLNSSLAKLSVDYTNDSERVDDFEPTSFNLSTYDFKFSGITINTHTNDDMLNIPSANTTEGDDNLYLRGFEGAFTVVDLFGTEDIDNNGTPDAFEDFKENKDTWLINEANLTFKVNNTLAGDNQPNRVMLYDIENKLPLADYFFDQTSSENSNNSRVNYSVPLVEDDNGNKTYKLRITEHIKNLLVRDSTNVKLGLFVSNNVNDLGFVKLKNPITFGSGANQTVVNELPQQSVVSNKGTVIKGRSPLATKTDEVKFEIYYTKED